MTAQHPSLADFSALKRGQQITLRHASGDQVTGVLEERADDASVVWVRMDDGAGRRLFHREDGYSVGV
jgi:cell envelope opacity-associated protein A